MDKQGILKWTKHNLEEQTNKNKSGGFCYNTDANLVSGGLIAPCDLRQYSCKGSCEVASSFSVLDNCEIDSVSLYFPSASSAATIRQVYLTDINKSFTLYPEHRSSANSESCYTYTFKTGFKLTKNLRYFIAVTGVNPYVNTRFRSDGLYIPYGSKTPGGILGSTASINQFESSQISQVTSGNDLPYYWLRYDDKYEIWFNIAIKEASFQIDQRGLNVIDGQLKVNNSEVVTKATIKNDLLGQISYDMFGTPLQNLLLKATGGTISGNLRVTSNLEAANANVFGTMTVNNLTIKNNGSWQIGTKDQRSDIILKHPKATIVSDCGNITIAAQKGDIKLDSFASFSEGKQCGTVTIPANQSLAVPRTIVSGVSDKARAILTPRQDTTIRYWVSYSDGTLWLNYSEPPSAPMSFDYLIISK